MVKIISLITFLIVFLQSSVASDIFRSLSDAEMTNRFSFVFEGHVRSTDVVQEVWEKFDDERVLVRTDFRSFFEVSEVIKSHPKQFNLLEVVYSVPGPLFNRSKDRYGPVGKGTFCRLYADNISFEENLLGLVKLKSVGQIRAGTVEERELEAERIAELREKSLLEPVGELESPKPKDKSRIEHNRPEGDVVGKKDSENPSLQPAKLRSNQSDVIEKNSSTSWLYWVLGLVIVGGVAKLILGSRR